MAAAILPPHVVTAHMRLAIEEMRKSTGRGPKVGAVVVNEAGVISMGHRVVGTHAERGAIDAALAAGTDLRGTTLFTTLEPCVSSDSGRESCAELISRVGIRIVYVGRYDTNPQIYRHGWKLLRAAAISVKDFPIELRSEIDSINAEFADHFVRGIGPSGGAKFDYQLNGGNFEIQFSEDDERSIVTRWVNRGATSIYAYANRPVQVALARYAVAFDEIDDPRAFDFTYTVPVHVGEIAVFVCDLGAVLVKVNEVEAGFSGGAAQRFVKIDYEVRAW
jgi:diaminohydroxyphosphoribosylaminopyrimidine deaminase/5-amino-6-(5-phosphoribosylamino)uracil reductase